MTRSISGLGPPEPAWKKAPSWAVVARGDKAAGADVVRSMAERAGAQITEAEGSRVIVVSRPQFVADVILSAFAAVLQNESKRSRKAMAEFEVLARADDLKDGDMQAFDVRGTKIAVANIAGSFYAFGDTCTHRGCSLAKGDLKETTVTCPCHGSEFDVRSGAVLQGPAREPVETYELRAEGENLEIKG